MKLEDIDFIIYMPIRVCSDDELQKSLDEIMSISKYVEEHPQRVFWKPRRNIFLSIN